VADLSVRRPFWLLAARHAANRLGRLHSPEPAGTPVSTPAAAERLSPVVPPPVHRAPLVHATRTARPAAADLVAGLRTRTRPVTRTPAATVVAAHRDLPMVRRAPLLSGAGTPSIATPPTAAQVGARAPRAPEPVSAALVGDLPVLGGAPVPDPGFDASASVTFAARPPSPVSHHPGAAPATGATSGSVRTPGTRTGPGPLAGAAPIALARSARMRPAPVAAAPGRSTGGGPVMASSRPLPTAAARPALTSPALTGPTSTSLRSTGPAWAGLTLTGPRSTGPALAGPTSTGPRSTGPASTGPASTRSRPPVPAGPPPSAEARWRSAISARPLESPRPFPTGLRPLVESLTGSAQRASYTTGPATRQALSAAGALGASTGTVVHLPTAPPATAGPSPLLHVVAHELAHARNPVSRPRFLLESLHGALDADERSALSVGQRFQGAAGQVQSMGAGIVGDLPVGGSGRIPDVTGAARSAVSGLVPDMHMPDVSLPQLPQLPQLPAGLGGGFGGPGGVSGAIDQAGVAVGQTVSAAGAAVTGALSGAAAKAGGVDIDHLAEVLEQRILRQIERRGGRYAGMF
jgi:hypothetical protein